MKKRCSVKGLLKEAAGYKKSLLKGNLLAIAATLLTVTIPLFIPILVDELLLNKGDRLIGLVRDYIMPMSTAGYVLFFLMLTLVMRGAGVLLAITQVKTFLKVSKDISYKLRKSAIEHLERVSLKEYELLSPGAVSSKLVTDVNTIDGFIGTTVSKLIISVLTLLFTSVVLLFIHWKLAIFILITNPIVVFFTAKLARNVGRLKREENRATEVFQATLSETLELFGQIRAANKEEHFFSRIKEQANSLKQRSIDFSYKSDRAMRLSFLTFLSGYEIFRSVSILAVAYSDLSVGLMLAIFGYLWIMMTPTQDLINFQYTLATARAACRRIDALFDMKQERRVEASLNPFENKATVGIEAKDLHFAYYEGKEILKGLDFSISAGEKVAIVGPSGSGKTTLANVLVGFYPPDSGQLYYGGVEAEKIDLRIIRSHVHLILQHPKLFNDTMHFNLTLGKDYTREQIEQAIKIAQLEDVISSLENGLNTPVGRDGVKLSGGQRQRVAIARMILIDPAVVIFDESTSALDIHTEMRLFSALREYLEEKTVVTIAHRLSTIEKAERIFVLEEGRLADSGTPEELMRKEEGYFAQMI